MPAGDHWTHAVETPLAPPEASPWRYGRPGRSPSGPTIFETAFYLVAGTRDVGGHHTALWIVVTENAGGRIIGIEPLKVMPVHWVDDDLARYRVGDGNRNRLSWVMSRYLIDRLLYAARLARMSSRRIVQSAGLRIYGAGDHRLSRCSRTPRPGTSCGRDHPRRLADDCQKRSRSHGSTARRAGQRSCLAHVGHHRVAIVGVIVMFIVCIHCRHLR